MYKLRNFVNITDIDWCFLSSNKNAIHLLENNIHKIDWTALSANKNSIQLLEKNIHKIDWNNFSKNYRLFSYD